MEPISAVLGFLGQIAGPVAGVFINRDKAAVAQRQIEAKERAALEANQTERERIQAGIQLAGIGASVQKDQAYYAQQVARTRAFYGAQSGRTTALALMGLGGVAALGLALYYSNKDGKQ